MKKKNVYETQRKEIKTAKNFSLIFMFSKWSSLKLIFFSSNILSE
jgi:hypothetical protein